MNNTPPPPSHSSHSLFLFSILSLCLLGLLMVASSTLQLADSRFADPWYYTLRQAIYLVVGFLLAFISAQIPTRFWHKLSVPLLFLGAFLLLLVLIPAFSHPVNGSMRWFNFGFIRLQPSEPMKLLIILYMAGYLIRQAQAVREDWRGFARPMLVLLFISTLLLLEPDYGATLVLFVTVLGMLFIAGVHLKPFFIWGAFVTIGMIVMILIAPYRLKRLTSFMNPWDDPFNSGFQLTQALIAIGRGDWFGVGLGNGLQKLTYLPEAHTDFLFAILAEELGLLGSLSVIVLFAVLIGQCFSIAQRALQQKQFYSAYLVYGIGISLGLQSLINLGVNMGLLPTKGLTLPLLSYGGSSLLVCSVMLGIVWRVKKESAD